MYKSNKYSLITYQSKKKELEKWVSKEQEAILKTKKGLIDNLENTVRLIDEANSNAQRIKNFFMKHSIGYDNDNVASLSANLCQDHCLEQDSSIKLQSPLSDINSVKEDKKNSLIFIQDDFPEEINVDLNLYEDNKISRIKSQNKKELVITNLEVINSLPKIQITPEKPINNSNISKPNIIKEFRVHQINNEEISELDLGSFRNNQNDDQSEPNLSDTKITDKFILVEIGRAHV